MSLMLAHPEIAFRDCEHCKKWWYDEKTGEVHKKNGKECPRPAGTLPCEDPRQECPKGHWKNPKTLNERNVMAYLHYRECRAVNSFPADGVVRFHAGAIREIEDAHDRAEDKQAVMQVVGLSSLMRGK